MAEPLSIASGALQVAGAGYQLAKTLFSCAKSIKHADLEITVVAIEVKLTSTVLESLADLLFDADTRELVSEGLQTDARAVMDGCKGAFEALNRALESALGSRKSSRISLFARARWPLRKSEMAGLQSNLERLKTTLMLMLEVLSLVSKQHSRSRSQNHAQAADDRIRIERLIKSNEDLYASIVSARTTQAPAPTAGRSIDGELGSKGISPAVSVITSPSEQLPGFADDRDNITEPEVVTQQFQDCIKAVERLSYLIEEAAAAWRNSQPLSLTEVRHACARVQKSIASMPGSELVRTEGDSHGPVQDVETSSTSSEGDMEASAVRGVGASTGVPTWRRNERSGYGSGSLNFDELDVADAIAEETFCRDAADALLRRWTVSVADPAA